MAGNAMFLVCDMINDLVHEEGPNGKKWYGPELARRKTIANTVEALRKARAAGVKIGYVRVGFSPDYRECPPNSRISRARKRRECSSSGPGAPRCIRRSRHNPATSIS